MPHILEIRQSDIALNVSVKEACALSNLTVLVTDFRLYTDSFHAILKGCASLRALECRWIICSSPIRTLIVNLRRLVVWDGDTCAFRSPGLVVS